MEQLTAQDLMSLLKQLQNQGEDLSKMPVYIADDEECNGIHCAWFVQEVNPNREDDEWIVEMIDERRGNLPLKGNKGIFIS